MATQPTPERWRPRISVRTLVILVTLVCCYAACWGPTKTQGPDDVYDYVCRDHDCWPVDAIPVAPLVIHFDLYPLSDLPPRRIYYFWFFGYIAKLPYEREIDQW